MERIPNQKSVICKRKPLDFKDKQPKLCIQWDTLAAASRDLETVSALKVYLYLVRNMEFQLGYSPRYISQEMGISEDSARNAWRELEQKGYLTLKEGTKATYLFHEEVSAPPAEKYRCGYTDTETGEVVIPQGYYSETDIYGILNNKGWSLQDITDFIAYWRENRK